MKKTNKKYIVICVAVILIIAIMVIYEIIRVDDSYAETVANAIETPTERERRISNRRRHITE